MMIWDLFIFSGWKEILKIGIILIKKKEKDIMKQLSECLLLLLTNEIIKSEVKVSFITDASNYFWQANQSTKAGYTYSNLMIAKGTVTDTDDDEVTIKFTMAIRMFLWRCVRPESFPLVVRSRA